VLDLAQIESGVVSLHPDVLDLSLEVPDLVVLYQRHAEQKGLVLSVDVPDGPVPVLIDRVAFGRVFNNVIVNAIKFTCEGSIVVRVTAGLDATLIVEDTGIGIAESFLPLLFEPFQQESTGVTRSHEGSGLGLAITRHLVDLTGGRISVTSEKHQGTRFSISYPVHSRPT
jgi:signal transduction histidine kinase